MADRSDLVYARSDARDALSNMEAYGSAIEDGRTPDVALAVLLAAGAICAELRALATTVEYEIDGLAAATGRA